MHPEPNAVCIQLCLVTVQQWTFVREVETDNWVNVVWNISPTRRKQQRMRHTAVSQLNSLLSRDSFTLFIYWKPFIFTLRLFSKLKARNFAFLPRFKDAWICHLASSFVSSHKNQRIQKKNRLAVWIRYYFSEGEKSLELGCIFCNMLHRLQMKRRAISPLKEAF